MIMINIPQPMNFMYMHMYIQLFYCHQLIVIVCLMLSSICQIMLAQYI